MAFANHPTPRGDERVNVRRKGLCVCVCVVRVASVEAAQGVG